MDILQYKKMKVKEQASTMIFRSDYNVIKI